MYKVSICILLCQAFIDIIGTGAAWLPRVCLDLEYWYIIYYSYSTATRALDAINNEAVTLPPEWIAQHYPVLEEYVQKAFDACVELLTTVVEMLEPGGFLKHMLVRYWLSIVAAGLFILKVSISTLRTRHASPTDHDLDRSREKPFRTESRSLIDNTAHFPLTPRSTSPQVRGTRRYSYS